MFLHSYEHTTPPTYHLELFFSVASYHLAWGLTPFSSFLCHQRTSFHFHFQSKIEILQAYLRVHPHKHMCTQKTHMQIHTDAHSLWTWTSFVCLSATRGEKKIEGGSERRSVEERGGKVAWEGLICTDGWSEHMLFSVLLFAWETVITVKKETGKGFFLWVAVV